MAGVHQDAHEHHEQGTGTGGERAGAAAPGSLADRGRRLFEFLAGAQQLKSKPPRTTAAYDEVLWLGDLPDHPAIRSAHRTPEPEDGQPLLIIERLPAPAAPDVPRNLQRWLTAPADDPGREPRLQQYVANPNAQAEDGSDARLHLTDHPDISTAYQQWLTAWRSWAERELLDRPVRDLYAALFSMYVTVTSHTEELELVAGIGLLAWAPSSHPEVRRHVLTSPAAIAFDDNTGDITIAAQPTLETLTLELDMLDPSLVPSTGHINDVRALARDFDKHPLHHADAGELVRRVVNSLSASGEYHDGFAAPQPAAEPRAAFAPALIVRKRSSLGLVGVFNTIAQEIAASGEVPAGLLPLLDPNHTPPTQPDPSDGALITVDGDDDVFLPLPLNDVQLSVIRRVDRHAQTLVQGPPGTGKTHTAAALLTHLLAQGKRVLVTAQTDRALKEVRSKLPESIKPLAVAVVGTDRSDMADLKVAVERISARSSDHDPDNAENTVNSCLQTIDELRRRRAQIRWQLVTARSTEVAEHEHAGYTGTLARIAQTYQAQAPMHAWLADFVNPYPDTASPLTAGQAKRWLELLRDRELTADDPESRQRLADLADLPDPETFATMVDAEAAGESGAAAHASASDHEAYETVAAMPAAARAELQARMRELARKARELEQRGESWMNAALHDIRAGRGATWAARAQDVRSLIGEARPFVDRLGPATDVTTTAGADPGALTALAQALHTHLTDGGTVKTNPDGTPKVGAFTHKAIKSARPLFDAVRVNAQPPTTLERLEAFMAHTDGQRHLNALDRAWPATVTIPAEDTLRERLQWHATELEQLDRLLTLGHELATEEQRLSQAGLARPDWNDIASVLAYAQLVDAAAAHEAFAAASQPLQRLEIGTGAVSTWSDAAETTHLINTAVRQRDRDQYAAAHARTARLHHVRELTAERDRLTNDVFAAAPDLAQAVLTDPFDGVWDARVSSLPEAWDWARTGAWILAQDTTDTNVLQAQIGAIETRLRREIEVLAATRAWNHAVSPSRLTGQSRADLTQYAQLVRSLGKGTGKYAMARRNEIRGAMDRCRPAVPVWILPIYRIAEQLRVSQNMFDVVIVDEASQAGLEASFLQYLAPKIVVIGDDKQVSPAAVGVDQQQLRDLAEQYLHDDRYKASWHDPKRSLFDEANMRFGSKLTLIEHRRCVPEIIGFSNRIAYEPDNIRLIPVRQYGADRLEPIKAVHLKDGYEKGTSGNKTNPPEIDAIVDQVRKCLVDPRYDGLTFGVISLQGQLQARRIESALLEAVPAEEWSARELRCGDAADFQGSERDVVFLSMVSAPEEGRRLGTMTQEMYVQRFNVAVSRAKDQLWLFHSLTLQDLPNSADMRHHLLDYCYGVMGRGRDEGSGDTRPVPEDIPTEPFDSLFEQRVYNRLVDRGFTVIPQYPANGYNLDLVVVGAKGRLAIECDGDAWHGPDAFEADLARQRDLERCGWEFFRIRESAWYVDQHAVLDRVWTTLEELDIRPSGWLDEALADEDDDQGDASEGDGDFEGPFDEGGTQGGTSSSLPTSQSNTFAERPDVPPALPLLNELTGAHEPDTAEHDNDDLDPAAELPSVADLLHTDAPGALQVQQRAYLGSDSGRTAQLPQIPAYREFCGTVPPALGATRAQIIGGLLQIVRTEGPVLGFRIHQAYVNASGQRRVGKQIAHALNAALSEAVRKGVLVADNPLQDSGVKPRTYRVPEQPVVAVRQLGPRTLDQVPPLELATLLNLAADETGWESTESLFRDVLHRLGRDRLSGPASELLTHVLPLARSLAGEQM